MRGKKALKRRSIVDAKFRDARVAKFINYVMRGGKKSIASKIVYYALDIVGSKSKQDPLDIFSQAIKNASPTLEVRSRRIGGANYQIPFPVRPERRFFLAANWIIEAASSRHGKPMQEKLAEELSDAASGQGAAVKKRQDVHRMAEANRAFAHFARY